MSIVDNPHFKWVILSLIALAICLLATIYSFWHKRYVDSGPRKGEAANPERVQQTNPPDRDR